jgi:hypothetical protein
MESVAEINVGLLIGRRVYERGKVFLGPFMFTLNLYVYFCPPPPTEERSAVKYVDIIINRFHNL